MKQNTWMRPTMSLVVSLVLVLLMGLAAMPAEAQSGAAKVQRVIFASAGIDENNRFWVVSRPNQLQNDPYLETLLDLDAKTGAFIPRLAEKWEANPDMKSGRCSCVRACPSTLAMGSSPPGMSCIPTRSCCVRRRPRRSWACGGT